MFEKLVKSLFGYCNKDLQFKRPPRLFIKQDSENSKNPLGKTAYYQPNEQSITVYGTGRHCKDMLRSIAHELVHHHQNERGDFDNCGGTEPGYAQNDEHLRNMEKEAYLKGNMLFRDWEDSCKKQMQMEDNNKMKLSELKKIIKETITQLVNERVETTLDGVELATRQRRAPGDFGPRRTGGDYKKKAERIKTSGVPPLRSAEYIRAEREFNEQCKNEGLALGSNEHRACVIVKLHEAGLREATEVEQQIEEEKIDEAGCDSHGKREDKKSKKEKTDEGKAHAKCAKGCQCEPIKEGEELTTEDNLAEMNNPHRNALQWEKGGHKALLGALSKERGDWEAGKASFVNKWVEAVRTGLGSKVSPDSFKMGGLGREIQTWWETMYDFLGSEQVDGSFNPKDPSRYEAAKKFFNSKGGHFDNFIFSVPYSDTPGPDTGADPFTRKKQPEKYGWLRDLEKDKMNRFEESKVMTVEKEKALKENYMGEKRNRLFEKLTKKWTK